MSLESQQHFSNWVASLPKAELHLHIDGSLQAHRLLSLARKNSIELPYSSVDEVEAAYQFENLQSFLDLYYLGASVLIDEDDFYHLMMDYLLKCKEQNIVHTEIMVEPQTYAPNGVSFATMMSGFQRAISDASEGWGQSVLLILSFLRHMSEDDCIQALADAQPYKDSFVAIGLASAENGNPPKKFKRLYQMAIEQGYRATAHAGEEGPPQYIWDSLNELKVERIDHGVRCVEDEALLEHLIEQQIALTVCPLSNTKLCVFDSMQQHNVLELLDQGIAVTINSDDPAYFDGYLNENFDALHQSLALTKAQALTLIENSFKASFLTQSDKDTYLASLATHC
ncbi:MAG: adenosine deaminase [Arenicella sp.]|jgi:adenosine deaminase